MVLTCDCWQCRGLDEPEWVEVREEDESASWHGLTGSEPDPFERVAATGEALAPLIATGPRYEPPAHVEWMRWGDTVIAYTVTHVPCFNTLTSSLDD